METKLDSALSTSQFLIEDIVNHIALMETGTGSGVLIYVREDIPSRSLTDHNIKGIFVELNLKKI